jgi:GxxExxY protein
MHENQIATTVVDCAFKVHSTLGPRLLESVYQAALAYELKKRGAHVTVERGIPVEYDQIRLELGFRAEGSPGFAKF